MTEYVDQEVKRKPVETSIPLTYFALYNAMEEIQ